MKKVIGILAVCLSLTMIGCSEEPAKTEVNVEAAEPAQAAPVEKTNTIVVEKEAPDNSTKIVLDKKGVQVETQKIDVKIEK